MGKEWLPRIWSEWKTGWMMFRNEENLKWRGVLAWAVHSSTEWVAKIGFEAGYNRVTNRAARSADTEDMSGVVRLRIVAR